MDRGHDNGQDAAASDGRKLPKSTARVWTRRLEGPVQYVRETDWGMHDGKRVIYFRFTLPPGQDQLPEDVYRVMKDHQKLPDGHPTGLRSTKGGKVWYMADHEHTRALADRLDMRLKNLAEKLEREPGRGR